MRRVAILTAFMVAGALTLFGCSGGGSTGSSGGNTITLGDGSLDARTSAWFETLCTGLTPVKNATGLTGGGSSDPKTQLDTSVAAFDSIGDALIATASSLGALPAPTSAHGDEIASTVVTVLSTAGPEVKAAAKTLSETAPTDGATVTAAIQQAVTRMTNSVSGLDAATYKLDPGTEAAIHRIPSCAAIGFAQS